jgi:hypothetical protein
LQAHAREYLHAQTDKATVGNCSLLFAALTAHNALRANHQDTPAMIWDVELEDAAETLANEFAATCGTADFFINGTGMNIISGLGNGTWTEVVDAWYSSGANYSFENPGYSAEYASFTQVTFVNAYSMHNCHQLP